MRLLTKLYYFYFCLYLVFISISVIRKSVEVYIQIYGLSVYRWAQTGKERKTITKWKVVNMLLYISVSPYITYIVYSMYHIYIFLWSMCAPSSQTMAVIKGHTLKFLPGYNCPFYQNWTRWSVGFMLHTPWTQSVSRLPIMAPSLWGLWHSHGNFKLPLCCTNQQS